MSDQPLDIPDDGTADDPMAGLLSGLLGGGGDGTSGGGFDLGAMLESAMGLQAQLQVAQAEAAATELEGAAGGGLVRITVTGGFEFRAVAIDPSVIDPDDPELLADLVLAALHDACAQVADLQASVQEGLGVPSMDELGGALGFGEPGA